MSFRKNPNLERELKRDPRYKAALANAAEPAARASRVVAHRIMPKGRGQQIGVEIHGDLVAIVNNDHGGAIDEFGTVNSPPYAPLRTGVRKAGLKFKGDR
jgi:hypothetical protein